MTRTTGPNNHPLVIETIKRAIDLDANNHTEPAVQLLTALAADFPLAASVHAYLAWFLLRGGQLDEAIEHGQEAVQLSPTSEKGSLVLFNVLMRAGQRTEALDEIKRFLAIRPSDEYASIVKDWEEAFSESGVREKIGSGNGTTKRRKRNLPS